MADKTLCDDCGIHDEPIFFCAICNLHYCEACWPKPLTHREGRRTFAGQPHLKENKKMLDMIHSVLETPQDLATLKTMHENDLDTLWLGVTREAPKSASKQPSASQSHFHDYGRYHQLMLDSHLLGGATRYPKLVSFVGNTSAGKSTLVKALVSQGGLSVGAVLTDLKTPVPGSTKNEVRSTSEGVHLYADPERLHTEMPILYADCEGLDAGENPPVAEEINSKHERTGPRVLTKALDGRSKVIPWANSNQPERSKRSFAVGHLYPRFLYTFSDAIVFVEKNSRQLHTVFTRLTSWAEFHIEKSLNQSRLPRAIVVLNNAEMGTADDRDSRWRVDDATNDSFLKVMNEFVSTEPYLMQLAASKGINSRNPNAAKTLLHCYYEEITFIRIPAKHAERYSLINDQITKLRSVIEQACQKAHYEKLIGRRLCDADELQEYLQAGFDHFAARLNEPFDFKSVSLRTRVIAHDFGDHIVNIADTVQECTSVRGKVLFAGLVSLISSCIILDYSRHKLPGQIMEYFPSHYMPLCKAALHRFCDDLVPCDFTGPKCTECKNVRSAHTKGHQNKDGKITPGPFKSSFSAEAFEAEWLKNIQNKVQALEQDLQRARQESWRRYQQNGAPFSDLKIAVQLHSEILTEFYSRSSCGKKCFSSATCFGCLMAKPEHPLGCGHILCGSCISEHADFKDDLASILRNCPLHKDDLFDWEVPRKPGFAGVRILSLDGGGIRGIVELEVLKAIEAKLNVGVSGSRLPIQRFFDLIVGTSTGGIIALSLTVRGWSVDKCIEEFKALCSQAFSERELAGTKLQPLATIAHGSKWRTTPLHDALKQSLGVEPLFGGPTESRHKYLTKVAVVSASSTTSRPLVMANYNREEVSNPGYTLEIYDKPQKSLRVWEAAAATSAAPTYFKPFECRGKAYIDGAINHNNPVVVASRERRLLWPDVSARHPDIFLSLGNGQNKSVIEDQILKRQRTFPVAPKRGRALNQNQGTRKRAKIGSAWIGIKNLFSVLASKIDNVLDTEWAWHEFYRDTIGEAWSSAESSRYIRINPDLKEPPPSLDAKEQIYSLHNKVKELLEYRPLASEVEDIANRLVASSFYFQKTAVQQRDGVCSGVINCKFEGYPGYIEKLGSFLKHQILGDFVPTFICTRRSGHDEKKEIKLDKHIIDDMIARKQFKFNTSLDIVLTTREEPMYIMLRLRLEGTSLSRLSCKDYPISGFPRKFLVEGERNDKRYARWQEERVKRHGSVPEQPKRSSKDNDTLHPSAQNTMSERSSSRHAPSETSATASTDSLTDWEGADDFDLEKTEALLRGMGDLHMTS